MLSKYDCGLEDQFGPTESGPAAPFGLLNELLSLRAELARSLEENKRVRKDYEIVTVELAAKDARIAELENKNSYNLQIVREATSRIAELEAAGKRLGDAAVEGALTSVEAVTELAEATARIAELEEKVTEWRMQSSIYEKRANAAKDPAGAVARAERAKVELDISRAAHRMVQSALLSQAAEIERAEAELKVARAALEPFADIASNYAGNRVISPDTYHVSTTLGDCYRASVALAPSPAGRELGLT